MSHVWSRNRRRRDAVVLAGASVLMAGCLDALHGGPAEYSLGLYVESPANPAPWMEVQYGHRLHVVRGDSVDRHVSHLVPVPRADSLPITVRLFATTGDTLAVTSFHQRFEARTSHWILGWIGPERPFGHCLGSAIALPARRPVVDTIFVFVGSIPNNAIC